MCAESSGMFTLKEINRVKIIQDVIERQMTTHRAAEHLGISDRQCRRLLVRYREEGPLGMANRRRGKPSNNRLPAELKARAITVLTSECQKLRPTQAHLHLATHHHIELSTETVRKLMTELNLWTPRKS